MAAEPETAGLESPEALREVILAQQRELETLRRENADVALLIDALDALLQVGRDEDPFAGVLGILQRVFRFGQALVLAERDAPGSPLVCISASRPGLVDSAWPASRLFEKVLGGRVTATISSPSFAEWPAAAVAAGLTAGQPALYLPFAVPDRRGLMMLLRDDETDGFDRRDVGVARKFSLLASHAFAARSAKRSESERIRLHQLTEDLRAAQATLAHRANYDVLTELPNRALFEDHVTRVLARCADGSRFALAFIDLDGFKQVNDHYGHEVGDELLRAVADRVRGMIRGSDMLARISGDEFVLLLEPLADDTTCAAVVERILARLKETFVIDGIPIMLSASIGLAVYPTHGATYEELRRNADLAMYSAKTTTKGTAAYFEPRIGEIAAQRTELEQVIRRAVRERRFRCVLQPIVDLRTMTIAGFEALARRVDADGGLRSPAEFIAVATQLGLLDDITDIVLDDLIDTLPALDEAFGAQTTVSLNVSARQATDAATMRALLARLAATGAPDRFLLELTEDAFLYADVFGREIVPLLDAFGARMSIDDFGTGYASLSTLLAVTPQELKIDRSFITRIHERRAGQVIVQAIASATSELGITVVAEGIETTDELDYVLRRTPVARAQGYLFAPPMPPEELIASSAGIAGRLTELAGARSAA